MKEVRILDKDFELFIDADTIQESIKRIAVDINNDLEGKDPIFIAILNGSFMFAGDLMKHVTVPSEITFVRIASYKGMKSSENIMEVMGLKEDIKDRTVVILEDIVDTGHTIERLLNRFETYSPKEIKVATLFKPKGMVKMLSQIMWHGVSNDFIVGYGLDYDGYGRNLEDIYKIKE